MDNETRAYNTLPTRDLRMKDTHRLKVREREKVIYGHRNDEKVGVAILISDKTDFETKAIKDTV